MKKFQSFAYNDNDRAAERRSSKFILKESETFEEEQDIKKKKIDTKTAVKSTKREYRNDIQNNPDDQVDIATQESFIPIGKMIRFTLRVAPKTAPSLLEKYRISANDYWYYFVESSNKELHFIKYNERKDTDMKFFVESLINHYLKNNKVVENIKNVKIIGNSNFVIIKDSPPKFYNMIKEDLIKLFSREDLD